MCFSVGASFGAGVILATIGVASIKKCKSARMAPFAAIPVIFSIQQLTEGFLWLSLTNPAFAPMENATTYLFLFIAQVIWPFWVPMSVMLAEQKIKLSQQILTALGILVSAYLLICLLTYEVHAENTGYHIAYIQNYPHWLRNYAGGLYLLVTIAPPFISVLKRMWSLGFAILISYVITAIFYNDYIVSVWCFFAAVISFAVYFIIYDLKRTPNSQFGLYPKQSV
jgi:hypothetical protein